MKKITVKATPISAEAAEFNAEFDQFIKENSETQSIRNRTLAREIYGVLVETGRSMKVHEIASHLTFAKSQYITTQKVNSILRWYLCGMNKVERQYTGRRYNIVVYKAI